MASRTTCPGWPRKGRRWGSEGRSPEEASQAQSDRAKPKKRRRGKRRGGEGTGKRKGVEERERREEQGSIVLQAPSKER